MVHLSLSSLLLLAFPIVLGAPTQLDKATLSQNGRDAQALNAEFAALSANDSCTTGQLACIGDGTAKCVNGKWVTAPCLNGQSCFALPSIKDTGVNTQCTSEATALSIISASGVEGGIAVNDNGKPVPFPSCSNDQSSNDTTNSTDNGTSADTGATATVTVTSTVTAAPSLSGTAESTVETRTISPQSAASLLSSIMGSSDATPASTPVAVAAGADPTSPPVITLTGSSSAAATGTAASSPANLAPATDTSTEPSPSTGVSSGY